MPQMYLCSRCGLPSDWLVTGADESSAPGRLLLYCDVCRAEGTANLWVAIPLPLVLQDVPAVMRYLYEAGLTETDPTAAADVLGFDPTGWVPQARAVLRRQPRP